MRGLRELTWHKSCYVLDYFKKICLYKNHHSGKLIEFRATFNKNFLYSVLRFNLKIVNGKLIL